MRKQEPVPLGYRGMFVGQTKKLLFNLILGELSCIPSFSALPSQKKASCLVQSSMQSVVVQLHGSSCKTTCLFGLNRQCNGEDEVFTIALSVMYGRHGPSYCGTLLITYAHDHVGFFFALLS